MRLLAPPEITQPITGRIGAMRADTLILFAEGSGIPLAIDFSSIKNLEVNKNKRTVAAHGAIAGFIVGGNYWRYYWSVSI